jgi:hypothetical protein
MMKGIRDPAAEKGMEGQRMEEIATMIRKISDSDFVFI